MPATLGGWPEPHPKPTRDILEDRLSAILALDINLASDFVMHSVREANPARFRELLQTCSDIDAVAVDVLSRSDDIPKMQSHSQCKTTVRRHIRLAFRRSSLDCKNTLGRPDQARKLHERAVARVADDITAVLSGHGLQQLRAEPHQSAECIRLIQTDKSGIPGDVSSDNSGEPAFHDFPWLEEL